MRKRANRNGQTLSRLCPAPRIDTELVARGARRLAAVSVAAVATAALLSTLHPSSSLTQHDDAHCGTASGVGAQWEAKRWQQTEHHNCSCTRTSKSCVIFMEKQGYTMHVTSPSGDYPAYTAFEVDSGTYGNLRRWPQQGRGQRWLDVGANLGTFSIALALANPGATGWAFEPNPSTHKYLVENIRANGLEDRITAVNMAVSRDGRPLQMPRCVVDHHGGSQMASTQWLVGGGSSGGGSGGGGEAFSRNRCFSGSCTQKAEQVKACMRQDPRFVRIPSMTLEAAIAMATTRRSDHSNPPPSSPHSSPAVSLLKVDCEGCEVGAHAFPPHAPCDHSLHDGHPPHYACPS